MNNSLFSRQEKNNASYVREIYAIFFLVVVPLLLGIYVLGIARYDLSIPLVYDGSDDVWQFVLTKFLRDTGWVLTNPFMGAPGIAIWKYHDAAQTSALHSVIMLGLLHFVDDAVKVQQIYYVLNFPLIALTSYVACRLIGISRIPAIAVAVLFAFTTFRITEILYAFLANYFMVPLGLVVIYWITSGEFAEAAGSADNVRSKAKSIFLSRNFLLGLLFVSVLATADGYYAFFELLLLGFAFGIRVLRGALLRPLELLVPVIYVVAILGVALTLTAPLNSYRKAHPDEFFPNGVQDPVLIKHPFEAEVYSSTLKLLISPQPHHRIPFMKDLGQSIIKSSDDAKLYKNGRTIVPLSLLCSVFFAVALLLLAVPAVHRPLIDKLAGSHSERAFSVFNSFLSASLFIFLCSIAGGLGTLVALMFPTIRAYDRFPLFLIFTLLSGAAYAATLLLNNLSGRKKVSFILVMVVVTMMSLFDQIPANSNRTSGSTKELFLAERQFVRGIEGSVDPHSMIYNYPHSQYLEDSPYYGWGSFAHIRLYLHSQTLRWSNGASKNSPVESWHLRVASLPLDAMINEIQGAGFAGIVIDRSVVPSAEYDELAALLAKRGIKLISDEPSRLAFAKLPENGFHLEYDEKFRQAETLVVTDRRKVKLDELPLQLDQKTFSHWLDVAYPGENSFSVKRSEHPDVFVDAQIVDQGLGIAPVAPPTSMSGSVSCNLNSNKSAVEVAVENASAFDWVLRSGPFPLSLGFHVRSSTGELIQFDNGMRFPQQEQVLTVKGRPRAAKAAVPKGKRQVFSIPVSQLSLDGVLAEPVLVEFGLVQDGNAWFNHLKCEVPLGG